MNIFWLILAYILGSIAVLNVKGANERNYAITYSKNIELENENNMLKEVIKNLTKDIDNKSRQIAVDALQEIIKKIQPQLNNKEIK